MDIQSQHWVALDPTATGHSGRHQFVRSFNNDGKTGIFAAISEPVPAELRQLAHNPQYYQRTNEGAVFVLDAANLALTDLIEQQLEFDVSFLDLLTQHWHRKISEHFANHSETTEDTNNAKDVKHSLSQLTHMYDATVTIVRMTEQQLMIYQIGYAKLLFLNEKHQIDLRALKLDTKSPSLQFLADPSLKKTFPCQLIDVQQYGLEMLMLLPEHYAATKSSQQLHDEAYQLSHLLDVKGREHVNTYLQADKDEAGRIVIKRNRRWYDGLSSALDRNAYYLNDKIQQQEQQIGQLKSQVDHLTQVTKKLIPSSIPPSLPNSAMHRYIDSEENAKDKLPHRPLYIENLTYQGEEKVHDKSRSGALLFSTLFLLLGLSGAYYLWQGQQLTEGKSSPPISLVKKDQRSRNNHQDTFVEAIKESTESGEGSVTQKVSMTLLSGRDANKPTSSSANDGEKRLVNTKQSKTDVMVTQIIMRSTEFAGKILQLNKKSKEIEAMDELFEMTKNKHYSHQKKLLVDKKGKLDKKIQTLSEQYTVLLKKLCSNAPIEFPAIPEQTSALERMAHTQLRKQLADCSKPKEITATHVGEVLRSHYRQLSSKNE